MSLLMRKILKTKTLEIGNKPTSFTTSRGETYDDLAMIALFVAMGGELDNECGIEPLPDFMYSSTKTFFRGHLIVRKKYVLEIFEKAGSPAALHSSSDLNKKYMPIDYKHCLPERERWYENS